MYTSNELTLATSILQAYVNKIEGWMAAFVPSTDITQGAVMVLQRLDLLSQPSNPYSSLGLLASACGLELYHSISNAGFGSYVTTSQCVEAAQEIIVAIQAKRGKK